MATHAFENFALSAVNIRDYNIVMGVIVLAKATSERKLIVNVGVPRWGVRITDG